MTEQARILLLLLSLSLTSSLLLFFCDYMEFLRPNDQTLVTSHKRSALTTFLSSCFGPGFRKNRCFFFFIRCQQNQRPIKSMGHKNQGEIKLDANWQTHKVHLQERPIRKNPHSNFDYYTNLNVDMNKSFPVLCTMSSKIIAISRFYHTFLSFGDWQCYTNYNRSQMSSFCFTPIICFFLYTIN